MAVIRELGVSESSRAYKTIRELRPHLQSEEEFVARVNEQRREGYRLVGAFVDGLAEPVAVAGFRVAHNLAWGHHLYVDDLVTREQFRSYGYGRNLMNWLYEEAQRLGCAQFHLDSGTHRHGAHRFYFRQKMHISSYHFTRVVEKENGSDGGEMF